jgi:transcriptional regulator with XRE-family HTH domain
VPEYQAEPLDSDAKVHQSGDMTQQTTDYFLARTGESARSIALKSGIDQSTLSRQLRGATDLKVETVVAIGRAYGLPLGELFVAVGFITEEEAATLGVTEALERATEEQLLHEMLRRVADGKASSTLTEPVAHEAIDNVITSPKFGGQANDGGYIDDAYTDMDKAAGSDETQADED